MNRLPFVRDVITLASGTALAQLIGVLVIPVITRLYNPDTFGNYAAFSSTAMLLSVAAAGRYEQAVMLPKSAYGARVVVWVSLLISLFVCGIALIILSIFYTRLDSIYNVSLGSMWIFVPILAVLIKALDLANMLTNRHGAFQITACTRVSRTIGQSLTQITAGMVGLTNAFGLFLGDILGVLLALVVNWKLFRNKQYQQLFHEKMRSRALIAAMRRYAEFPIFRAPSALINQTQNWLTLLLVGALFASNELGQYFLMHKVVMLPSMLVGGAVAGVYYQRATKAVTRQGQLYRLTLRLVIVLAFCGITFAGLLIVAGEQIFTVVFGNQWQRAGHFAALIAPYIAAHFVLMPLGSLAIVVQRIKTAFMLTAIQNIVFVLSFWSGAQLLGGIEGGLISISAISTCYLTFMVIWNLRIARITQRKK